MESYLTFDLSSFCVSPSLKLTVLYIYIYMLEISNKPYLITFMVQATTCNTNRSLSVK